MTITITEVACATTLANEEVDYMDPMQLTWKIRFNEGGTWFTFGTSENVVCVTLAQPTGGLVQTIYETVARVSCQAADGQTTQDDVKTQVWSTFTSKDFERIDGTDLQYYGSWLTSYSMIPDLLLHCDGECIAWAKLFVAMLKVHGRDPENVEVEGIEIGPKAGHGEGFLIKEWDYVGQGHGGPPPIYHNIQLLNVEHVQNNAYVWGYSEAQDNSGPADHGGQNQPHPRSNFLVHWLVKLDGTYYDPSYGTTKATLAGFDADNVSGYYDREPLVWINEANYGGDTNGNHIPNENIQVIRWLVKQNPTAEDLEQKSTANW